jgi:hypothetical protein
MRTVALGGILFLAALVSAPVRAQTRAVPARPQPLQQMHDEDGGIRETLESIVITPMARSPFTATLLTEWVRTLANGGTITVVNQRRIARDSVNEDAPDQDVWRKFIAQQKMDWAQVSDKNAAIYQSFHLAPPADLSLPRYVLLDRNGAVLRVYDGLDRLGLVVGQIMRTVTAAPKPP